MASHAGGARLSGRRVALTLALAAVAAGFCSLVWVESPALADSCPNAQYRTGYSAYLPDCRAYEQVTPSGSEPLEFSGAVDLPLVAGAQASSAGGALVWETRYPLPGSPADGYEYMSRRGASGWSTQGVVPPQSTGSSNLLSCAPTTYFSPDLSADVLRDGLDDTVALGGVDGGAPCSADDPSLVAGEPQGSGNLFSLGSSGSYQLVDVTPSGVGPSNAVFEGGSSDFSSVVFEEPAQLTSDAPVGNDLYDWTGGSVSLVGQVPAGSATSCGGSGPACFATPASLANGTEYYGASNGQSNGAAQFTGAVAGDGSRVFFQANGNLYVREDPTGPGAMTVQVDASQAGGPGGGGTFMWASSDGSLVYFTDDASARLTSDTVAGSGANLYQYDVSTGQLTDLTAVSTAEVQGVAGVSTDGSYVYFVANGALAGAPAGDCQATVVSYTGNCNLYVWHSGAVALVATLSTLDARDWGDTAGGSLDPGDTLTARVSPSGRFIAFNSDSSLTGYPNAPAVASSCIAPGTSTTVPCTEIFRYDAASGQLSCVSCDPSGAPPTGPALLQAPENLNPIAGVVWPAYLQRSVLDDGRVFFNSPDPLVPGVSDGQTNVYESEPEGVGSCALSAGCVSLISTGTSGDPSFFYDASASGDDVFFITNQDVLDGGADGPLTVYDARVDGGFPASSAQGSACSGSGSCEGEAATSPPAPTAGTATFSGPGDQSGLGSAARKPTAKVNIVRKAVKGQVFSLTVKVPARGRVTITGARVLKVSKVVGKAGSYKLTVRLTSTARRRLQRAHRLKVTVKVSYRPATGSASSASASLTVKA